MQEGEIVNSFATKPGRHPAFGWLNPILILYCKPVSNLMNSFNAYGWIRRQESSQPGDKYIHAATQEKIVFPPYMQQYVFPSEDLVRVCTKKGE
jgi:hypothetical protein